MAHAWLPCRSLKGTEHMKVIAVEMLREWLDLAANVTDLEAGANRCAIV